jgi:hypothetical protein
MIFEGTSWSEGALFRNHGESPLTLDEDSIGRLRQEVLNNVHRSILNFQPGICALGTHCWNNFAGRNSNFSHGIIIFSSARSLFART